jgi:hypothetical protein
MKSLNHVLIDSLLDELSLAKQAKLIPYFHLGKVPANTVTTAYEDVEFSDVIDLYIGLNPALLEREIPLKKYLREKYGSIIRVLVVETY